MKKNYETKFVFLLKMKLWCIYAFAAKLPIFGQKIYLIGIIVSIIAKKNIFISLLNDFLEKDDN